MTIKLSLPIRTVNSLNSREHWSKRARRAKRERHASYIFTPKGIKTPVTVTLVRLAPKVMDDDGLSASFKNLRDGIADKLGVDDGSPLIKWVYVQRVSKEYGIQIEFE